MPSYSLSHLRGPALEASLDRVAASGAGNTALQLAHLAELDSQGYYADAGCSSMFRYCVDRRRMSEDVAVQWIRVARVARMFPCVFEAIAARRLTVSAAYLLSKRLTTENVAELLAAAEGRSNKQVYRLLAERFGRRSILDVPPLTAGGALPAEAGAPAANLPVSIRVTSEAPLGLTAPDPSGVANDGNVVVPVAAAPASAEGAPAVRARLTPLGQGRYELVAILEQEAFEQLEAARDLLGHAVPNGALAEVLERAIALLHEQLRKRRCAATEQPREGASRDSHDPRHVPAEAVRAVWERDGGQCAYVSPDGHRCTERFALELDHVVPVARGGQATVDNLRLLCRAHNQHAAKCAFGREHVEAKREAARNRQAAERYYKEKDRERTEQRRAEIARQREELGEAFRQLGYRGRDLEIALAWCATRPEVSLEERLKYALGRMAPRVRHDPAPAAQPESPPAVDAA